MPIIVITDLGEEDIVEDMVRPSGTDDTQGTASLEILEAPDDGDANDSGDTTS